MMTTEDRAALVAAISGFGARAPAILARLGERGLRLAATKAEAWPDLVADAPPGLERAHPSWTGRLLPAPRATPAVRRWLRRATWGGLVPMPEHGPAAAPAAALEAAIATIGRRRLAMALRAAPTGAAAEIAARLGEHGPPLLMDLEESTIPARGAVRAAVVELADALAALRDDHAAGAGERLLFRAGARSLAPAIAAVGGDLPRQLAQRLPRERGELLLAEVARVPVAPTPGAVRRLARLLEEAGCRV